MNTSLPQPWPLNIDFTAAIQNPPICFRDDTLRRSQPVKNRLGRVLLWSGNFATVYKLVNGDRAWAVRCFTRVPPADVQQRYEGIARYLERQQLPYLVKFEFQAQGIYIKQRWYPLVKMEWVEGQELDRFIGDRLDRPDELLALNRQLQQLKRELRQAGIAHGDLQHGNILVTRDRQLKLVDYDGMYVPTLRGLPSHEIGHPNYQPPARTRQHFDDRLDDFSFNVISLSLSALARQPELWNSFHEDNKNLIFREDDFKSPETSPVFQSIAEIEDPETQILYQQLVRQCSGKGSVLSWPPLPADWQAELRMWRRAIATIVSHQRWVLLGASLAILGLSTYMLARDALRPPANADEGTETAPSFLDARLAQIAAAKPIAPDELLRRYKAGDRDFQRANLSGANLKGAHLAGIDLRFAVLEGTSLELATLTGANLNGANLTGANLRGAKLDQATLDDIEAEGANLMQADLAGASLLRANLRQANLELSVLSRVVAVGGQFERANLAIADLRGADLLRANLRRAKLLGAKLDGADLGAADLTEADLQTASLTRTNLRAAEFSSTKLLGAKFQQADLSTASFSNLTFDAVEFQAANFHGVRLDAIASVDGASFANIRHLSEKNRQYLCNLADLPGGIALAERSSARQTLRCPTRS